MRRRHDILIDGKPYKMYTAHGMLFGQVAEVPATPFAQKRSQGATTLADSLTLSYFGMDSFHGGRGQDKARSPFAFMDSKRMISFIRDRAIPGPKPHTFTGGAGVEHVPGNVSGISLGYPAAPYNKAYAESFVCPGGGLTVSGLQFYMRLSDVGVDFDVEFALYDDSAGSPGSKLKSVTMTPADFTTSFGWIRGVITDEALTPTDTYWAVVERLGVADSGEPYYILGHDPDAGYSGAHKYKDNADVWQVMGVPHDLYFRVNYGLLVPDFPSQAIEFYPSTADYIYRTLFFAMGKGVYYSDEVAEGGWATGGGSDYLDDTNRSFGVDTYNTGYTLYIFDGKGEGQSRDITATAATRLTVSPAWDIEPEYGSWYVVRKDAPELQESKVDFVNLITDMKIFKDKLYVAQGLAGTSPIWTLTGASATTTWAAVTGIEANYLLVHVNADGDLALWRAFGNKIDCSTDGTNFGDDIEVGDQQHIITGMRVYAGEFFVFKEDSWYLVDLEEWKAERVINFETQPDRDAFKAHCEYAGELYTGKGAGTWRYTPGPDMTPVGVDRGALVPEGRVPGKDVLVEVPWEGGRIITSTGWGLPYERMGKVSAMVALTNFMYQAIDAGEQLGHYSSVLVYNRVGYGEIIRADSPDKPIRMLHFSPEVSPEPRLWWGEGKTIKYAKIPDLSDNPYLWGLSEYIEESEVETSKYDAGRILHGKTVIVCGVQSENLLEGSREIEVCYEADRSGLWVLWGTITKSPYQEIYMSASDIGSNKTVAAASTVTVIKVDSTTGMVAGEWVRIGTEHRQVLTIDSSTQFTVTLPFTTAPSSGDIVYGGWPVVHEVALKFRGTTDDMTIGWALCGFVGGWVPRPPREWSRTVLVEISDDAVETRTGAQMWQDLVALADRPEPIVYKDYWGTEHNVFILEPSLRPLAEGSDAIDKKIERAYAAVKMLDVALA